MNGQNAPSVGWVNVMVKRFNGSPEYVSQLAVNIGGKLFLRRLAYGSWSSWREL